MTPFLCILFSKWKYVIKYQLDDSLMVVLIFDMVSFGSEDDVSSSKIANE
jgi:hypothetical protein